MLTLHYSVFSVTFAVIKQRITWIFSITDKKLINGAFLSLYASCLDVFLINIL